VTPDRSLADALDDALPRTQCTRCGYADCRGYAEAIAAGSAPINRCPPGGAEGITRLAALTGHRVQPLDPANGREGPRLLARIEEADCIGCTLCLQACPVDCIVGAPKRMHTVIAPLCTGCELCLPACPVDCIVLAPASGMRTGWHAWSAAEAAGARARHAAHRMRQRCERDAEDQRLAANAPTLADSGRDAPAPANSSDRSGPADADVDQRRRVIEAALARARERRSAR
jgi:electron transport complex protein RnfB